MIFNYRSGLGQIRAAVAPRRDNLGPAAGRLLWDRPNFGFAGYFALNRLNFNLKLCPVSISIVLVMCLGVRCVGYTKHHQRLAYTGRTKFPIVYW